MALGGAWVEAEGPSEQTRTLGLDWFVRDLLVPALVFVPLERYFAQRREQKILRAGFRTDLAQLVYPFRAHAAASARSQPRT